MLISSKELYGHIVKNEYFCMVTENNFNDERFIR